MKLKLFNDVSANNSISTIVNHKKNNVMIVENVM